MNRSELNSYRRSFLQLGWISAGALALWACAPEISNAVATTNIETPTNIPTETPTTTPEPTPSPTPEVPQPGEVWIEQMGQVEPLDLEMTTEFTIEYEKMPKITWEDGSSGRLRETLLQKWKSERKLTPQYIEENEIYAVKPGDWRESLHYFFGEIAGNYLGVSNHQDLQFPSPYDYAKRPFIQSPEVFELIGEDGEREGMVTTSMVVFERPDGTKGIEPWFYYVGKDSIGLKIEGGPEECLGGGLPNTKIDAYPNPTITLEEEILKTETFTPFRTWAEWNETGRYEVQGELLRRVISDGYPSPELGKEFLTATCVLYGEN